jgi:competence protein ComEC
VESNKLNPLDRIRPKPAPLLSVAAAVIVGILFGRYEILPAAVFLAGILFCLVAAGVGLFVSRIRRIVKGFYLAVGGVLCVGFICLGALRYCLVYHYYPANHVITYLEPVGSLATLKGTILTEPYYSKSPGAFSWQSSRTVFTLDCEQIETGSRYRQTQGVVQVSVKEAHPGLELGQQVRIDGWLYPRQGPWNPGEYDRRDSYRAARNLIGCTVNYSEAVRVSAESTDRVGWLYRLRRQLAKLAHTAIFEDANFEPASDSEATKAAFLEALLLGQRHRMSADLSEVFMRTGTMHYLSVSGFHVGLLAGFVWWGGWLLRCPRWLRGTLTLITIAGFVLVVPERAPILRAGVICSVFCIAYMTRRTTNSVNLLSFAAILLLLWRPMDLFNAGFQLSFVVVLGIVLFAGMFYRRFSGGGDDDSVRIKSPLWWQKGIDENPTWWQYLLRYAGRFLLGLIVVAMVAWGVGMPLAAYHFNRLALWGPLASAVLFPFIALAMLLGFAKLLLAGLLPTVSLGLGTALGWVGHDAISTAQWLSEFPYSCLHTATPPLWFLAVFYGLLVVGTWSQRRGKGMGRYVRLGLVVWGIGFVWQFPFQENPAGQSSRMDVLAVGHGSAIVIQLPDGKVVCYDAGSKSSGNLAASTILPFLRSRGIGRIEALFISHPNLDHYNGALELCRKIPVKAVYISDYYQSVSGRAGKYVIRDIEGLGIPVRGLRRGSILESPDAESEDSYQIQVLWPGAKLENYEPDSNDSSLVLRIVDRHGAFLLCGDIGEVPQRILQEMENPDRLQAEVLLLPHHGAITRGIEDFVQAVDPELCVNSCGKMRAKTFTPLEQMLSPRQIIHTYPNGAITVSLTNEGILARTFREAD